MPEITTLLERYQVLKPLGEGAQSEVLLVRDLRNHGVLKAAKILKADTETLPALLQEFHLLENLAHPNLVRVFDFQVLPDSKKPMVLTEYVENAQSLENLLRAGTLTANQKIQIAFQMLSALAYLHNQKVVHGDMKPSNALVSGFAEGELPQTRVIDFGVSHDLWRGGIRRAGTPLYLAPEVLQQGISPASDLYSVGVIFYRFFYDDQLPYQRLNSADILRQHQRRIPLFANARLQKPDLHPFLSDLVSQLLQFDPLKRPTNLAETLRLFRLAFPDALAEISSAHHGLRSRRWLGEQGPLQTLTQFLGPVSQQNTAKILAVCAPSGGGKTRFLQEAARLARETNRHPVFSYYRAKNGFDYLVQACLNRFPDAQSSQRMRPQIEAMVAADKDDGEARLSVYPRYLNQLAEELGGLVLLVDGLGSQPAQDFSKLLRKVTRQGRGGHDKLRVILSVEPLPEMADQEQTFGHGKKLLDLMEDLNLDLTDTGTECAGQSDVARLPKEMRLMAREGLVQGLFLNPWGLESIAEFLEEADPQGKWGGDFATILAKQSRGNPGALEAILSQQLGSSGPQPTADVSKIETIHDLNIFRLRNYQASERLLLAFAASQGLFSIATLTSFAEIVAEQGIPISVQATVARAFDDGLIQLADEKRQMFQITGQNLRRYLRNLAKDRQTSGIQWSRFWKSADRLDPETRMLWARYLGDLQVWARDSLALYHAERWRSSRLRLRPFLDDLLVQLESVEQAAPSAESPTREVRQRLVLMRADLLMEQMRLDEAEQLALSLLSNLELQPSPDDALQAEASLCLGLTYRLQNRLAESGKFLSRAAAFSGWDEVTRLYIEGQIVLGNVLSADDPDSGLLQRFHQIRKSLRPLNESRWAVLTASLAGIYARRSQFFQAIRYFEFAAQVYERLGETTKLKQMLDRIGRLSYASGDFPKAIAFSERFLQLAEREDSFLEMFDALLVLIRSAFRLGHWRLFARHAATLLNLCVRQQDARPLSQIIEPAAHLFLERGETRRARALVDSYRQLIPSLASEQQALQGIISDLLGMQIEILCCDIEKSADFAERITAGLRNFQRDDPQVVIARQVAAYWGASMKALQQGCAAAFDDLKQLFEQRFFAAALQPDVLLRLFHWAAWSERWTEIEPFVKAALEATDKMSYSAQLECYRDFLRGSLESGQPMKAREYARRGEGVLAKVENSLVRASFLDQLARNQANDRGRLAATRTLQQAEREYQKFLRTWDPAEREHFTTGSKEWIEHRLISAELETNTRL